MACGVGLGIDAFLFSGARDFWRWVDLCEVGGVDSIWQSDRMIGDEPNLECLSVMAALAGRTRRVKFGMNVASLALRDPVLTAKACATIDVLSQGRLLPAFGIGVGGSADYESRQAPSSERGKRSSEGLEIISRLWSEEQVTFAGQYYRLDAVSLVPRPLQRPLPLWLGGSAPAAIERTARIATGWLAGVESPVEAGAAVAAIKRRTAELGRRISEDHFGAGFGFRFGAPDDPLVASYNTTLAKRLGGASGMFAVAGDSFDIMRLIDAYRAVGVHKFVLRPIARDGEDFLAQTRLFIETLMPKVAALNTRR